MAKTRTRKTRRSSRTTVRLGDDIVLDFSKMMKQGLALIGNSGSGKTLAERHVIEETRDRASQVIFDMSGEALWTLREKFDYMLVGPNGDMPADPAIAADLARFVRERPCHVIVDLSGLEEDKQRLFIQIFGDALLLLPESLWETPLILFFEEVHIASPQEERPASRKTIGNLSTLGRRQRICLVITTQRLAEVAKKLLNSINNRLYGRFIETADLTAAANVLGLRRVDWPKMQQLDEGWFHCMGPAFGTKGVFLARTDEKTLSRHVDRSAGTKVRRIPASKKVSLLAKDLFAKQAAIAAKRKAEDNEIASLRQRVKELEGGTERKKLMARIDELLKENASTKAAAAKKMPAAKPAVIKALSKGQIVELRKKITEEMTKIRAQYTIEIGVERKRAFLRASNIFRIFAQGADSQLLIDERAVHATDAADRKTMKIEVEALLTRIEAWPAAHQPSALPSVSRSIAPAPSISTKRAAPPGSGGMQAPTPKVARWISGSSGDPKVTGSVRRILTALAQHPEGLDRDQIAMYSGVSPRSSGLPGSLTTISANGWSEKRDGKTFATQAGLDALGEHDPLPEGRALVDYWLNFCSGGPRRLLEVVVDAGYEGIERNEAAQRAGISVTSSGLPASITELTKAKFIVPSERGKRLTASQVLLQAAAN